MVANQSEQKNRTTVERLSDRELVVRRTFDAPARMVFDAWTKPELMKRWWAPRSHPIKLVECEMDVRTGGSYRLGFEVEGREGIMSFFGKYTEVIPNERLVWTNDEGEQQSITTVTFEEAGGKTHVATRELFASPEALAEHCASGADHGADETHSQLDELLASLAA